MSDKTGSTDLSVSHIDEKYRVVGKLGGGGFSDVYLVEGPTGVSALKLLKLEMKAGVLDEFRHEFEILKDMRHPHIAGILDFGFDDEIKRHYFTSEYIEGRDIVTGSRDLTIEQKTDLLVQTLRALEYLHSYNIYHFDIKATNVLVLDSAEPKVKIIDFGLAGMGPQGKLIGTPSYMPPEIISREHADGRADLYSLGALWYYVLVRSNPFRGKTSAESMDRQLHLIPELPSKLNPQIPQWVDKIVMRLLEKNPANRYFRPAQVIREINRFCDKKYPLETLGTLMSYLPEEGRFVGRVTEIDRLDKAVEDLKKSEGAYFDGWHVEGELGVGKTRFIKELKYRYQLKDMRIEFVSANDSKEFGQWCDEISNHISRGQGSIIFILDDAHALMKNRKMRDRFIALISYAHRPSSKSSIMIIVSMLGAMDEVTRSWESMLPNHVALTPFTENELNDYLVSLTGLENPPSSLLTEIFMRTEGNPLFVTEVIRSLITAGALFDEFGRWNASLFEDVGVDFSKAGVPKSVEDLLMERLDSMPENERYLLEALSVAGKPLIPTELGSLVGIEEPHGAVAKLVLDGILSKGENYEVTFKNALMEQVLYESIHPEKREELHDTIVDGLDHANVDEILHHKSRGSDKGKSLDALITLGERVLAMGHGDLAIEHLRKALNLISQDDYERQVELQMKLGEAYLISHDYEAAKDHFRSVENLISKGSVDEFSLSWRVDALTRLGGTYSKLQEFDRARASFTEARELLKKSDDDPIRINLIDNFLAGIYLSEGNFEESKKIFENTRQEVSQLNPEDQRKVNNNDLGVSLIYLGKLDDAKKIIRDDLGRARELGDDLLIGRACYNLARASLAEGKVEEGIKAYLDCVEVCRSSKNTELLLRAYNGLGNAYQVSGDLEKSIDHYERGHALHERIGDPRGGAAISINMGIVQNMLGNQDRALDHLIPAVELLKNIPDKNASDWVALSRGLLECADIYNKRADYAEAKEKLDEAIGITSEIPAASGHRFWALASFADVALAEDDMAEFERVISMMRPIANSEAEIDRLNELEGMDSTDGKVLSEKIETKGAAKKEIKNNESPEPYRRILEINKLIAAESDLDYVLKTVLYYALELAKAEAGAILLLGDDDELVVKCKRNMEERDDDIAMSLSIAKRVLHSGDIVITDDAMADDNLVAEASISANKLRSILCLPICSRKKTIGVLYLDHRFQIKVFSDVDMEILEAFADQVGLAIDSAQRLSHLALREHKLESELAEVSRRVERYEEMIDEEGPKLRYDYGMIAGRSASMQELLRTIDKVADTDISVFICGESGTGKELIARSLHENNQARKNGRFMAINCAAIPATLIESELFGYKKGSFTGASKDKIGLIEEASGGTLFLDEIGDLDPALQVKLLRVLQERECTRIGDSKVIPVDIRVVAASNRDIDQLVKENAFREDLYYRLCQMRIDIPPLRERPEDLTWLAKKFVEDLSPDKKLTISTELMKRFIVYEWPGNIRELENLIEVACALTDGDVIDLNAIPENHPLIQGVSGGGREVEERKEDVRNSVRIDDKNVYDPSKPWREYEALIIAKCYGANNFKVRPTAKELGIAATTLYKRMDEWKMKEHSGRLYLEAFDYTRGMKLDDYIPLIFKAALDAVDGKASQAIANLRVSQGYFYKVMKKVS
ncbi:MAG: sigma 54-interacting transcriptional regulator [Deltaproteobacteria bacterium]|nr:sigma 54-interacting transcriptional regulator [Deltaproteobacteria bacterium]